MGFMAFGQILLRNSNAAIAENDLGTAAVCSGLDHQFQPTTIGHGLYGIKQNITDCP